MQHGAARNGETLRAESSGLPGQARINGIVIDLPQFATAFQCAKTAVMVKPNACNPVTKR